MNTSRHQARREALQILYQLSLNTELNTEAALQYFDSYFSKQDGMLPYAEHLVRGVSRHLEEIDKKIGGVSENWRLDRMTAVDRSILRLGAFELCYCDDVPKTVTLNEMVELAKQFGSENSAAFINGLLDKISASIENPNKAP